MEVRKWVVKQKKAQGVEELVEEYARQYEARHRRKIRSLKLVQDIRGNLGHLLNHAGFEDAMAGIKAVFTHPKLKWVSYPDGFLATKSNFEKYVVPVLSERSPGEQSEWQGPKDVGESREMSPEEFANYGR